MRAWMDDEQPVVQQLQILRCLRFVEFIGQGLIKEVHPLTLRKSASGKRVWMQVLPALRPPVTAQDLVTLTWDRGYRQTIADIPHARPAYDSVGGHLFAQVTHFELASGSPLRPESCLLCSRPSRCTCEGPRLRLRGCLRCGRAPLRRRMGSG
jgi:hypothetical protein